MKLNLAGGEKPLPGYLNIDLYAPNPDHRVDLFKFPWPWEDSSIDAIAMFHFLEHVPDLHATLKEVNRVLCKGGEFWVIVPHQANPCAYDIDHKSYFTSVSFTVGLGNGTYYHFGGKRLFQTTHFKMPWLQDCWTPLDKLLSWKPLFCEKILPFIVPAHIEWKGVAIK